MNLVLDEFEKIKFDIDYSVRKHLLAFKCPKLNTWGEEVEYLDKTLDEVIMAKKNENNTLYKQIQDKDALEKLSNLWNDFHAYLSELLDDLKLNLFKVYDTGEFKEELPSSNHSYYLVNDILIQWIYSLYNYEKDVKDLKIKLNLPYDKNPNNFITSLENSLDEDTRKSFYPQLSD